jgi:hypothetical protein
MTLCDYLLWSYLKEHVYLANCSGVASETEALAEEITGEMCDTAHNFVIHLH